MKAFAGLNPGTLLAGILIVSLVAGLIPVLAFLTFNTNLPKPVFNILKRVGSYFIRDQSAAFGIGGNVGDGKQREEYYHERCYPIRNNLGYPHQCSKDKGADGAMLCNGQSIDTKYRCRQ